MIVVKLIGGLGNQMFQYAAGLRLAKARGAELKMDPSWFEDSRLRGYELGAFPVREAFASREEVLSLTVRKRNLAERIADKALRRRPQPSPFHFRERHFRFHPEVLDLPDETYLDGYWQSERYFADAVGLIRSRFEFSEPEDPDRKRTMNLIEESESASVHIRRGDYASDPETRRVHGLCPMGYYRACADEVRQIAGDARFFVFSDDPEWVRGHFDALPSATVVGKGKSGHEDMNLMARCRFHIIANSSFSWWAAWLCRREGKAVFGPDRWFADEAWNRETQDLFPEGWRRIRT